METFLLNDFADLITVSSKSIEFHNFGNKAEGKYSSVLKRTRSSLYDFMTFKERDFRDDCTDFFLAFFFPFYDILRNCFFDAEPESLED